MNQEFEEVPSSDETDGDGSLLDNHLGLGDTEPSLLRVRRDAEPVRSSTLTYASTSSTVSVSSLNSEATSSSTETDSDSEELVRHSSTLSPELKVSQQPLMTLKDTMCTGIPPGVPHTPGEDLSCYTCKSSTSDSDPQCDTRLWKYLRHSEKFGLR